ncbi:unnamed protein product [Meganyctiphanes norvegica]|uniref:Peptidase S1 domain-containing protein n=1 Tax=Meganyctiphanes norvegica TaxID=48144 RepID=A0AAV2Q5E9_MEGNR
MRLKYLSSCVLLVLLTTTTSINAEEKDSAWSWGAEEALDPNEPLPLESESPRTSKDLSSSSDKVDSVVVLEAAEEAHDSPSIQFEESGSLTSDDVSVSLEEQGDESDSSRSGRFLGLSKSLCSLGIGSNCNKNFQPAVQSHYGTPVKRLTPAGSYGPPPVHIKPAGNYGPPPIKGYGPPVKQGPYPAPVIVPSKSTAKPPKGFLGSIGDAVSSFLYKKDDAKHVAPYDAPKHEYVAPKPAYNPPKASYHAPKGPPHNTGYAAPKPSYVAVNPAYTAPKPAYNPPKPAYAAPKPAYNPPKPAYAAPKPAYHPPKAVYNTHKPAYTAPKATYAPPNPAYTVPKATYAAPVPIPTYTAPKATYVAPTPKPSYTVPKATYAPPQPAYTAPKATYAAPKPAYTAPKATYVAPTPKPAYTAPKATYAPPKPAYAAPKATYAAPTHKPAYTAPKASYAAPTPKPAYTAPKATYAAPKPAYAAPKVFVAPTQTYAITKPIMVTRLPTVTVAPTQSVVHHVHQHTHVYEGKPSVATVYAEPAPTFTATPAIVNVPSVAYAQNSDVLIHSGSEQSVYVQAGTVVSLNEVKSYEEDCQCVPADYCPAGNIIHQRKNTKDISHLLDARNNPSDISHLLDARNSPSDIKSNSTDANEISNDESARKRRNTDEEVSEENNDEEVFTDRQGRQLKGFTPGTSGCTAGYVCCRRPVYNPSRPKQASVERKPSLTIHSSNLGSSRPSSIAQQPNSQSKNRISNHNTSGVKSHFAVSHVVQENPKPTVSVIASSNRRHQVPAYNEDCHCILENFCAASDVVPRNSQKDISHLLDARNKDVDILSTATDNERVRRSTDNATLETTGNDTESTTSTDRQGRQLLGVTPGAIGCRQGYVCCRRPVFNANRPKQINAAPSNAIANTNAFGVKTTVQQNPKPTVSVIASANRRHQGPAYNEDCHCIPVNYCPASDVVPRNSPKDISHLLDARNKDANILSTATDSERVRRSTDDETLETTGNDTESRNSTDRQGRQLLGETPGAFGCRQGYACCRRPVFKPKKIKGSPFNAIANTAAVPHMSRPVVPLPTPSQTQPKLEMEIQQATRLQDVVSPYSEDCHCIPRRYCPANNIVPRNSPKDISHLLDARNKGSSVLSTASQERARRSTNETSDNDTDSEISARQGRQLQGYTPSKEGCGVDYVCCRRPVYTPTRTQKAIRRPVRKPAQVHSQHTNVPQVQRVSKPTVVSTHAPKPVVLVAQQSLLQHQVPAYREQCTCVAPNFCQQKDLVARNSPSDISHLLDARNSGANITSNATESRSRRSTNEETDSVNDETLYSDRQGRQVKSFPPGVGGCHAGTVCCRQPNFSVQNALSTASRPSVVSASRPSVISASRPSVVTASRPQFVAQTTNVLQPRSKYTCGKSNSQSLLGRVKTPHFEQGDTEFGEYPWQAAILKMADGDAQYVCGAALIDDQHLLTAAHCIDGIQPYNLKIRLGEWDVASESEFFSHIQVQVSDVYTHKDYYKGNLQNDIAVMKLTAPVDFASNPHITPVCLPDSSDDFRGQQCTVTGWGKDAFGSDGKFQKILKEVSVPVVDHHQCQDTLRTTRLGRSYSLDQGMLCAGGEEGKDACKGDGGSPLVCKGNDGAYRLSGLVSWGIGCGDRGIPGVYVNIQHYITWINAIQNS